MGEVPEREDGPGDAGSERGPEVDDREFGERDDGGGGEPRPVAERERRLPPLEQEALVEILEFVAKSLVADPDAVAVELVDREGGVTLRLTVHQADMGKIIGRAGRTARAIRVLMRAAGTRAGVNTHVEIVEEAGVRAGSSAPSGRTMGSTASGPPDRERTAEDRVAVGRVTRAHGVHGEVSVLVLSEVEGRFAPGAALHLDGGRGLTVSSSRPHRARLLVRFEEVPDRTAAEELTGAYLFVPAAEVPAAPEGSFWPHQLVGCEILTDGGRSLGRIAEVLRGTANDVWVARDGDVETLVPALADVVVSVDVEDRRVVVREVPGMTFERDE